MKNDVVWMLVWKLKENGIVEKGVCWKSKYTREGPQLSSQRHTCYAEYRRLRNCLVLNLPLLAQYYQFWQQFPMVSNTGFPSVQV